MASQQQIYDKILAGLVTDSPNLQAEATKVRQCIQQFSNVSVPGFKKPSKQHKGRGERTLAALQLFDEELQEYARLAEIAIRFYEQVDGFLTLDTLEQVLASRQNLDKKESTKILALYDKCSQEESSLQDFHFWLKELVDSKKEVLFADALANAMQAMESRFLDKDSSIIYEGYDGAVDLIENARQLPGMQAESIEMMRSGNIREEMDEILQEVDDAATGVRRSGSMYSGFRFIDEQTDGFSPGDIVLVGAHTGEGKSQFCHNVGYYATFGGQALNGLVLTIETARPTYRRRILCRHTNEPGIGKIHGIPYKNIKTGRFSSKEEQELFGNVVTDFCTNPAYGILDIGQATQGMTMEDARVAANRFQDKYNQPLHYMIIDYLALVSAIRPRSSRREELNDILQEGKSLATSFNGGTGMVLITPHQTKQNVREVVKPENGKFYTVRDYADTSEAGKTIDVGVMLLRDDDLERQHEIAASLVKCRDAESPPTVVRLYERYKSSYLGNMVES